MSQKTLRQTAAVLLVVACALIAAGPAFGYGPFIDPHGQQAQVR